MVMQRNFILFVPGLIMTLNIHAEIVKTSWYSNKQQEPAVFSVKKIDPERTVVDIEVVDGMSYKQMFMYFIEENGKETVYEHNTGYSIALYLFFITNNDYMKKKFKKIFLFDSKKFVQMASKTKSEIPSLLAET